MVSCLISARNSYSALVAMIPSNLTALIVYFSHHESIGDGLSMAVINISIDEFREQFENSDDYQFIDVREVEEWREARIPNVINIPLSEFEARYQEITTDKPVVLVCRSGGRSHMAGQMLTMQGYDKVYNLSDGTLGWINRNLPTEQDT